jgi:hypothetical protein
MPPRTVELARLGNLVVEKKYGLTYEEFAQQHLFANVPVVLGDACASWAAKDKFTPEFFKSTYGDREITVEGQVFKLADYIDLMAVSTEENPAPYPCKLQLDRDYPELLPDVTPRFKFAMPDRCHSKLMPEAMLGGAETMEVFFGSPGGQFPYVHYDYMCLHAYITQLYGIKEFTVIPPSQTPYVYPKPGNQWVSEIPDIRTTDLAQFPLFAQATPLTFRIGPGETLFIPCGWWHTARSITSTISVALDCLNASNWSDFRREVATNLGRHKPLKGKAAQLYLAALGPVFSASEAVGIAL